MFPFIKNPYQFCDHPEKFCHIVIRLHLTFLDRMRLQRQSLRQQKGDRGAAQRHREIVNPVFGEGF